MKKEQFYKEIWPQERDVISRPERMKYLRRVVQPDRCVFCVAEENGPSLESLCLFKNSHAMVVINKYPYNSGHLLVLPRTHCGEVEVLDAETFQVVNELLRESIRILKSAYQCEGLNVGLNLGSVAGAGLPDHLHWHVIPRWYGDTNFFPLVAETKVVPESLEQTYEKLHSYFSQL